MEEACSSNADTLRPSTPNRNRIIPDVQCPVCLQDVLENISSPNTCQHKFCFECLMKWSKINRQCPICKRLYRSLKSNIQLSGEYEEVVLEELRTGRRDDHLSRDVLRAVEIMYAMELPYLMEAPVELPPVVMDYLTRRRFLDRHVDEEVQALRRRYFSMSGNDHRTASHPMMEHLLGLPTEDDDLPNSASGPSGYEIPYDVFDNMDSRSPEVIMLSSDEEDSDITENDPGNSATSIAPSAASSTASSTAPSASMDEETDIDIQFLCEIKK